MKKSVVGVYYIAFGCMIIGFGVNSHYYIAGFMTLVMLIHSIILKDMQRTANHYREQAKYFESMANTDELTNLPTRKVMYAEFAERREAQESYYIMMIDIDNFKYINDHWGHLIGDKVIMNCANILKTNLDEHGHVFRWGGEEFLVIFAQKDECSVFHQAEYIRKKINKHDFIEHNIPIRVTVSIGIGWGSYTIPFETAIHTADQALYVAKNSGKNKVVLNH